MKKLLLMAAALLLVCPNSNAAQTQKEFTRGVCTTVTVSGDFNVVLSEKYRQNVLIDYDELLKDYLVTEIKGSQLTISYAKGFKKVLRQNNVQKATVYLDANFASYTFDGNVSVTSAEQLSAPQLKVKLADASTMNVNILSQQVTMSLDGTSSYVGGLNAKVAKIDLAGTSTASLSGSAASFTSTVAGTSSLNAASLQTQSGAAVKVLGASTATFNGNGNVKIAAEGNSHVSANVTAQSVAVTLAGTSDATLTGNAKMLKLSTSGQSRFVKSDFAAEASAKIAMKGSSSVDVCSRGTVNVTAGDNSSAIITCGSTITVAASGVASVLYNGTAKLTKLTLKDQATAKAIDAASVAPAPAIR